MKGKIISLVGCPASGKTYLADKLAEHYKADIIYERPDGGFDENIMENLATQTNLFETIVWFRNHQIENYEKALSLARKGHIVVLDTPFYQNQLYVDLYVEDTFKNATLKKMGTMDFKKYPLPDCTIYISTTEKTIKEFLTKRAGQREWETQDWFDFITKISPHVERYMSSVEDKLPNLLKIDRSEYDFEKPEDFEKIVKKIDKIL